MINRYFLCKRMTENFHYVNVLSVSSMQTLAHTIFSNLALAVLRNYSDEYREERVLFFSPSVDVEWGKMSGIEDS